MDARDASESALASALAAARDQLVGGDAYAERSEGVTAVVHRTCIFIAVQIPHEQLAQLASRQRSY